MWWKQRSGTWATGEWVTCFFHILTSSVVYYWKDPWQHGIYSFFTINRKGKRQTYLVLLVWGFVPGWAFFKSSRTLLFSLLLLFSWSYLYTVSPSKNFNAFTCSQHNNRKNMRVSRRDDTRWQLLCGRGGGKTIEMWRWWWYITSLLTELCWHKSWVWGRWGLDVGLMWSMLDRCRVNVGSMWDRHGGGKIKIK